MGSFRNGKFPIPTFYDNSPLAIEKGISLEEIVSNQSPTHYRKSLFHSLSKMKMQQSFI